ncbi:MAG: hypothetical protein EOM69_02860, partial [Clostridia bacterium]|nr:hypothetical protein [Clostridia bacterium]
MEWNKVKSILIVLLLLVDVILGVTVAEQYLQVRTRERASVSDAAQLLRRDGLRFDEQMFFDLPVHLCAWTIPRDDATELRVATALLGECESETAQSAPGQPSQAAFVPEFPESPAQRTTRPPAR